MTTLTYKAKDKLSSLGEILLFLFETRRWQTITACMLLLLLSSFAVASTYASKDEVKTETTVSLEQRLSEVTGTLEATRATLDKIHADNLILKRENKRLKSALMQEQSINQQVDTLHVEQVNAQKELLALVESYRSTLDEYKNELAKSNLKVAELTHKQNEVW